MLVIIPQMVERQVISPAAEKNGNTFRNDRKESFTLEVKNKDLTPWEMDAVKIIDGFMVDIATKRNFFLHFLIENQSWETVKQFRDINEGYFQKVFVEIADKFIYDERKVALYNNFHQEWNTNRAKELLIAGVNYHDIHDEFDIERNELRSIRRKLFEEGKLELGLSENELMVYEERKEGVVNNKISKKTKIPHNEVNRTTGKLLLMGLIDPLSQLGKMQAEETRYVYDEIIDFHRMGLSTIEISREMREHYFKIRHAKYRLRQAGEITDPPVNKIAEQRKEEAEERRAKIKAALKDPNVLVEHLPELIKDLTVAQAKRNVQKLIRSGDLLPRRKARRIFLERRLRRELREHLKNNPGKDFPFWEFIERYHTDFGTSIKIFDKIEHQEVVPNIFSKTRSRHKLHRLFQARLRQIQDNSISIVKEQKQEAS